MNEGDDAVSGDVADTHIFRDHVILADTSVLDIDTFSTRNRVH